MSNQNSGAKSTNDAAEQSPEIILRMDQYTADHVVDVLEAGGIKSDIVRHEPLDDDKNLRADGGQPACYTTGCQRSAETRLRLTFTFCTPPHELKHNYCEEHAAVQIDSTSDLVEVEEIDDPEIDILPVWDGGVAATERIATEPTRDMEVQR